MTYKKIKKQTIHLSDLKKNLVLKGLKNTLVPINVIARGEKKSRQTDRQTWYLPINHETRFSVSSVFLSNLSKQSLSLNNIFSQHKYLKRNPLHNELHVCWQ